MTRMAAILVVLVVSAGCAGTSSANRPFDPAMRAASTVTTLEQTILPVTKEQAAELLPPFRALRGTPGQDRPAVEALVRQIDKVITDAQREELRRLRAQQRPGAPGAPPGGPPPAGQPSAERLAAFRGQLLDRAIALLETRVP